MNSSILRDFETDLRLRRLAVTTIESRVEALARFALWLSPVLLLNATSTQLVKYQRTFAPLAPASVDIYTRHLQAFYRWAKIRNLIEDDPTVDLMRPKLRRGRPHPTELDDLRAILACTTGPLRVAYILAAFEGLRCAEVARLQSDDITLTGVPTARIIGKGDKERIVPLIEPVVHEMLAYGLPRHGYILRRRDGQPFTPKQMSTESHNHLRRIGIPTTMHSLRHLFATHTYRSTRDLLLVSELLGHSSVATTQIYALPDMSRAHESLHAVSALATDLLGARRLHAVG